MTQKICEHTSCTFKFFTFNSKNESLEFDRKTVKVYWFMKNGYVSLNVLTETFVCLPGLRKIMLQR